MSVGFYRWLECEVEPGLFDTERNVHFLVAIDHASDCVDLLVDEVLVRARGDVQRGQRVPGRVRVSVVRQEGANTVVLLPVQSLKYGSYVAVPADRLQAN